jgi:hypothetical protein
MKQFISLCLWMGTALICHAQERSLTLSNPAASTSDLVELDYTQVAGSLKKGPFKIINAATRKEIAYQLIFEGGKAPVKILLGTPVAYKRKPLADTYRRGKTTLPGKTTVWLSGCMERL